MLISQKQSDLRQWGSHEALANVFLKDARSLLLSTLTCLRAQALTNTTGANSGPPVRL